MELKNEWFEDMLANDDCIKYNSSRKVVPLKIQCLLLIAGNALDSIPFSRLCLLPHSLRKELLYLLPALDVCKLDGTPFTDEIKMNEIWEVLYRERLRCLVLHDRLDDVRDDLSLTRIKFESSEWKNSYFTLIFAFNQFTNEVQQPTPNPESCRMMPIPNPATGVPRSYCNDANVSFSHLLYCIHDRFECFNTHVSHHSIGITSPLFSHYIYPPRYSMYFADGEPMCFALGYNFKHGSPISFELVDLLVNQCQVSLVHLFLSSFYFNSVMSNLNLQPLLPRLLKSVRYITFFHCCYEEHLESLLDFIFKYCVFSIKGMYIGNCPCMTRPGSPLPVGSCSLLPVGSHHDAARTLVPYLPPMGGFVELAISGYMSSMYTRELTRILEEFGDHLEYVYLSMDWPKECPVLFTQCLICLFNSPILKELRIHIPDIPSDGLYALFRVFFSCSYPVSFSTLDVECSLFKDVSEDETLLFNYCQPSKCLHLTGISFLPASILPPCLFLKSLTVEDFGDSSILQSLATVGSLYIESVTVHTSSDLICSDLLLFVDKVKTRELNIFLHDSINDFLSIDLLRQILLHITPGCLRSFGVQGTADTSVYENVFRLLIPTESPYFELYVGLDECDYDRAQLIHAAWKAYGREIKLKRIDIL